MDVCRTIDEMRTRVAAARAAGLRIGFVPTMGALHDGHVALIDAAQRDGAVPVVSIFVNPTQFGPHEDFHRYPRDETGDLARCAAAGAAAVFLPSVAALYPAEARTVVHVRQLGDHLCGPWRPGHFDGVCTIVAKLFHIVRPDRAYFGEKDAQQLAIIRRMTIDLDLPIEIVGCPTVREADGLALSSRNRYLSADERRRAPAIYAALQAARAAVAGGAREVAVLEAAARAAILAAAPSSIDYVQMVDAADLQPILRIERPALLAVAVRFGGTRLIDNVTLRPGE